jgi:hypothetical protein
MSRIADTVHYRCPEPVLLIVGGDPPAKWNLKAYVFPKGKCLMELVMTNETPGSQSEESSAT